MWRRFLRPVWYSTNISPNPVLGTNIFIGSAADARWEVKLHRQGISNVLNVADNVPTPEASKYSISYLKVGLDDVPSQSLFNEETKRALDFIDQTQNRTPAQRILVHCRKGVSRSVSVVILWLMTRRGMTYDQALQLIRLTRPMALPNPGFAEQLKSLSLALDRVTRMNE